MDVSVASGFHWRRIGMRLIASLVVIGTLACGWHQFAAPYFPQQIRLPDGTVLRYEQVTFGRKHTYRVGRPDWVLKWQSRSMVWLSIPWSTKGMEVSTTEIPSTEDTACVWLSGKTSKGIAIDSPPSWKWDCHVLNADGQEIKCQFLSIWVFAPVFQLPQSLPDSIVTLRIRERDGTPVGEFRVPNPYPRKHAEP